MRGWWAKWFDLRGQEEEKRVQLKARGFTNLWSVSDVSNDEDLEIMTAWIDNLLPIRHKKGMENTNPVSMPLDPNMKLVPNPVGKEGRWFWAECLCVTYLGPWNNSQQPQDQT